MPFWDHITGMFSGASPKGTLSFIQVCFGLNLAQIGWKNLRDQYKGLLDNNKEISSDVSSDLMDEAARHNKLSKVVFYIYLMFSNVLDFIQRIIISVIYVSCVISLLISALMLYLGLEHHLAYLLLIPPIGLPLTFLLFRLIVATLGNSVHKWLKLPSGVDW